MHWHIKANLSSYSMNNSRAECRMQTTNSFSFFFLFLSLDLWTNYTLINGYIFWFFFSLTIRWIRSNWPLKVSNKRRCATSLSTFCSRHVLATDIKLFAHRSNSPSSKNRFLLLCGAGLVPMSVDTAVAVTNDDLDVDADRFWQSVTQIKTMKQIKGKSVNQSCN